MEVDKLYIVISRDYPDSYSWEITHQGIEGERAPDSQVVQENRTNKTLYVCAHRDACECVCVCVQRGNKTKY